MQNKPTKKKDFDVDLDIEFDTFKNSIPPILEETMQNEPQCNCIMSGFAQTTNYCPVHKGVPMKNVPQKMYRFKKWTSDEERAEVMKIIKYTKDGLIYQDSYDAHPELQTYFESVEPDSQKTYPTGEPQLSVETEAKFEKMWTEGTGLHDRAKHFLATALEEQSIDIVEKLNKSFYENELATALKEQKKATLDLLDKAELEKWFDMPDTTENWKTWKKIRNTINREDV